MGVTYRQIAGRLHVSRGAGRPRLNSARPRELNRDGNTVYLDSDASPTLITFDAECNVDVALLLASGAVVPWTASAPVTDEAGEAEAEVE